jgi:hypothetical protein
MRTTIGFLMAVAVCVWAVSARADWDPQNPDPDTKWVQLPDLNGWDVNVTGPNVLADDFMCTETGVITDVHLWGSWKGDNVGQLTRIRLAIFSDIPAEGRCDYSQPGDMLWNADIDPSQVGDAVLMRPVACGDQGWYSPAGDWHREDDHEGVWQVNILLDKFVPAEGLFHQDEGTIYWLAVSVETAWPDAGQTPTTAGGDGQFYPPKFGWKTSSDHWNDDAVWGTLYTREDGGDESFWNELIDPTGCESLDLAFVLTGTPDTSVPEPGIMAIFGFGVMGLLVRRRKER